LSLVFGTIFTLVASLGGVYAWHLNDRLQQMAALLYAGAAVGVVLVKDFYSLFIFWELMAIGSTYLIWARKTPESAQTGMRYLLNHIFGGGLLFAGILLHVHQTGSTALQALPDNFDLSSLLILAGVALNTAIPPLHAWLPDAYPKATLTGSVFMSAFTTKSAVYVLMILFPGWDMLVGLGVLMTLYGVAYAILANDIRSILSYHIISQVGYMVTGVGIGTQLALNGAAAHAFCHILYKSLLFMGAGTIIHATGKSKLTELGGLASSLRLPLFLYMIGAVSISGFPLFNGFTSKSLIIASAGEAHYEWTLLLLLLASTGTFLSVGLKLPIFTWLGTAKTPHTVKTLPQGMLVAMSITSLLCFLFGVYPSLLYRFLPYPVTYQPYTVYHLVETTQILLFTFLGFWLLRKKLVGEDSLVLDVDWFYRKSGKYFKYVFVDFTAFIFSQVALTVHKITDASILYFNRKDNNTSASIYTVSAGTLLLLALLGLAFFK